MAAVPVTDIAAASTALPSATGSALPSIHEEFIALSAETRELYIRRRVPRIPPPSPLSFYRDYVAQNVPCLIEGAIDSWPALSLWKSSAYLLRAMGDAPVTVALTPNGRADAVHGDRLALPLEEEWPFARLLEALTAASSAEAGAARGSVVYCQQQNASFSSQFAPLHEDVCPLEWASVAFNDAPDAVNCWIGSAHSLSSLHHDPYDNLYAVVTGTKRFLLYPPTDLYWLEERMYQTARWTRSAKGDWALEDGEGGERVPWVADVEVELAEMATRDAEDLEDRTPHATDPAEDDAEEWDDGPLISRALRRRYASALYVEVRAGELLYLPSLWYHCVAQEGDGEGKAIAINQWYDMQYGPHWAYYQHLRRRVHAHYAVLRQRREQRKREAKAPIDRSPLSLSLSGPLSLSLPLRRGQLRG